MYNVGDFVVYGAEGVCKIENIGFPDIPYLEQDCYYYTLSPVFRDGVTYIPMNTKVFMRPVISYDEVQSLIREFPDIDASICEERNAHALADSYKTILETHDCKSLLKLLKGSYIKRDNIKKRGKKIGQVEERYIRYAEDALYGEFAVVLNIPKDEVEGYLYKCVEDSAFAEIEEA